MEYQTILIGSGVAAATIAHTLLQHDAHHLLLILEAGPRVPSKDRRLWWDLVVHGRSPYEHCHDLKLPGKGEAETENESIGPTEWNFQESRMMGYGGSTFHWGGWALRFKPEDFELYSRTQRGADWPITYRDLEPFYGEAEDFLGVSGSDPHDWAPRSNDYPLPPFPYTKADGPMIQAFRKLGITYAPMPIARFRKCMTTGTCKYCPFGARFSASYVLDELSEPGRAPNLKIQTRSPVSALLLDRKDHVIGVRYLDCTTGQTREVWGERFIICAGSYESAKLLLRSRNTFWTNGVGNDSYGANTTGLVGHHIISHPFLYVRGRAKENPDGLQQELDFPTLMSRHFDTPKEQPQGKLFLFRDRSKPKVDLAALMIDGAKKEKIAEAVKGPVIWELQGLMEEFANPHNRVELGNGMNRLGLPQTRVYFDRAEGFAKAAEKHLHVMKDILREMGLEVPTNPNKPDDWFGVREQRGDHAAATCRMAKSPEHGVVDENLRVHGVTNLFVCSNAVFPSGAAVNPTLTLTALALRLGKHLV